MMVVIVMIMVMVRVMIVVPKRVDLLLVLRQETAALLRSRQVQHEIAGHHISFEPRRVFLTTKLFTRKWLPLSTFLFLEAIHWW